MDTTGIGGTCDRCSTWLNEARIVRAMFSEPSLTQDIETSARLRLRSIAQRLVLHDCGASPARASA